MIKTIQTVNKQLDGCQIQRKERDNRQNKHEKRKKVVELLVKLFVKIEKIKYNNHEIGKYN